MKKDGDKSPPPPPRPEPVRGKYAGRPFRVVIETGPAPAPASPPPKRGK